MPDAGSCSKSQYQQLGTSDVEEHLYDVGPDDGGHAALKGIEEREADDEEFADTLHRETARLKQIGSGDSLDLIEALEASLAAVRTPMIELDSLGIVLISDVSDVAPVVP